MPANTAVKELWEGGGEQEGGVLTNGEAEAGEGRQSGGSSAADLVLGPLTGQAKPPTRLGVS
jgi:hypothetical protein